MEGRSAKIGWRAFSSGGAEQRRDARLPVGDFMHFTEVFLSNLLARRLESVTRLRVGNIGTTAKALCGFPPRAKGRAHHFQSAAEKTSSGFDGDGAGLNLEVQNIADVEKVRSAP